MNVIPVTRGGTKFNIYMLWFVCTSPTPVTIFYIVSSRKQHFKGKYVALLRHIYPNFEPHRNTCNVNLYRELLCDTMKPEKLTNQSWYFFNKAIDACISFIKTSTSYKLSLFEIVYTILTTGIKYANVRIKGGYGV